MAPEQLPIKRRTRCNMRRAFRQWRILLCCFLVLRNMGMDRADVHMRCRIAWGVDHTYCTCRLWRSDTRGHPHNTALDRTGFEMMVAPLNTREYQVSKPLPWCPHLVYSVKLDLQITTKILQIVSVLLGAPIAAITYLIMTSPQRIHPSASQPLVPLHPSPNSPESIQVA